MAAGPRITEGSELGSYRILRKLGEGGMGAVFEGEHTSIGRHAAIKVLHREHAVREDVVQRFFNEARAVNLIDHPALVQTWDFGQAADGTAYIVMEFLRGESLGKKLKREGPLAVPEALEIVRQIASALAVVHERGIVHRDLKPDNVMLIPNADGSGRLLPKLLDFGIAKLMEGKQPGDVQTRTDAVLGTPAYMSPEQCRGANKVDGRADVYSLGVMLYEMLAGRRPFVAEGSGAVFGMHMYEEPMPIRERAPHVPEPVAALVHRLMTKDRNLRPTASEAVQLAQQLSDPSQVPVVASPPSRTSFKSLLAVIRPSGAPTTLGSSAGEGSNSSLLRTQRTRPRPFILGAVGLTALLLVGGAWLLRPRPQAVVKASAAEVTAEDSTAQAPAAVAPRMVLFQIASDPPGVEVVNSKTGAVLGSTPLSHRQPAVAGPVSLSLRRPGYQSVEVILDGESNHQVDRRLQPVSRAGGRAAMKKPGTSAGVGSAVARKNNPSSAGKPEAPRAASPAPNFKELLEK